MLLKTLFSFCLWSLSHIKTHKPGFPCKSQRITFKVTQRDDQYACIVLLPTISQYNSCKFITSYSPEKKKKLTYLKLTLYSLTLSVREKGNLGVGNCRAHLPCICVSYAVSNLQLAHFFSCARSVMCACLQIKWITVKPAGTFLPSFCSSHTLKKKLLIYFTQYSSLTTVTLKMCQENLCLSQKGRQ